MEDFKKCNSFSEMGRCLGYDYYNGYVKTEIIKFCQNNDIDPYEIIKQNKTPNKCLYCGKELEGKDRFRKKFCNSSCAASYNNKKRGPISVETRRKISDSLIIYNEGLDKTNHSPLKSKIPSDHICVVCGQNFKSKYRDAKYCSSRCRGNSEEIKEKLRQKVKERICNGTFSGWKSRNIVSYPEEFWMGVLFNNNIDYKHNFPFGKYFLDFYIEIGDRKIDLEIDGKQHEYADRSEKDVERDIFIKSKGVEVYRVKWNSINNDKGKIEMKEKIDDFLNYIKQ